MTSRTTALYAGLLKREGALRQRPPSKWSYEAILDLKEHAEKLETKLGAACNHLRLLIKLKEIKRLIETDEATEFQIAFYHNNKEQTWNNAEEWLEDRVKQ